MRRALAIAAAALMLAACIPAAATPPANDIGTHVGTKPIPARLPPAQLSADLDRLVAAYPDFLAGHQGDILIWKDGTRSPVTDGVATKTPDEIIASPSVENMFVWRYPLASEPVTPPTADPGRARPAALFDKMYGNCHAGGVAPRLVKVRWVDGTVLRITSVNGVDKALAAVVADLTALGPAYRRYLTPSAGTYNCRVIAGTQLTSMHAWGAAIDLNVAVSDYWQWSDKAAQGLAPYRNRMAIPVVQAFERHGFIWGGRWADFDTMHFEYRPEMIAVAKGG